MPYKRIVLGFLIAPFAALIALWMVGVLIAIGSRQSMGEMVAGLGAVLLIGIPFAYATALVIGVPAYLLLRRSAMLGLRSALAVASVMGVGAMVVLFEPSAFDGVFWQALGLGAAMGAAGGLAFWWIALRTVSAGTTT